MLAESWQLFKQTLQELFVIPSSRNLLWFELIIQVVAIIGILLLIVFFGLGILSNVALHSSSLLQIIAQIPLVLLGILIGSLFLVAMGTLYVAGFYDSGLYLSQVTSLSDVWERAKANFFRIFVGNLFLLMIFAVVNGVIIWLSALWLGFLILLLINIPLFFYALYYPINLLRYPQQSYWQTLKNYNPWNRVTGIYALYWVGTTILLNLISAVLGPFLPLISEIVLNAVFPLFLIHLLESA